MEYKPNVNGKHIVLKYPSETRLSEKIKIVWSQS